jgi:hypothetical protein
MMTHSATALLCSLALLSGCGGGSSATVAANDSNVNTTTAPISNTNTNTNTTPTTPAQPINVAGKAYVGESEMVVIYAGGNATVYSITTNTAAAKPTALTWGLDGTTLTLASASGTQTFTVAVDGTTLTAGSVVYRQGKALFPAKWAGVALGASVGQNYYVTWRFAGTQVVITEKGGSGFLRTSTLDVAAVAGVDNVWSVQGMSGSGTSQPSTPVAAYIVLLEGEPSAGSRWQWVATTQDSALSALGGKPLQFTATAPVAPVNTAPIANPDTATTPAGQAVTLAVLANDSDANGDTLTIAAYGQGKNGAVTPSGSRLVYTPRAGWSGVDTFSYTVKDAQGATTEGRATVTVAEALRPALSFDTTTITGIDASTKSETSAIFYFSGRQLPEGLTPDMLQYTDISPNTRVRYSQNAIVLFHTPQTDGSFSVSATVTGGRSPVTLTMSGTASTSSGPVDPVGPKPCNPNKDPFCVGG